jgi:probable HAF family extracellular repeat protein
MQDLGTLGGANSSALGINDKGEVTGGSYTSVDTASHAFLWNGRAMQDLGTLGGAESYGYGINSAGEVTGYSYTSGYANTHAFLWTGTAMQDLGTLGGQGGSGYAIDSSGRVVGSSGTLGDLAVHAFLWDGTSMLDLNTLTLNGSAWDLQSAEGINDSGQITGYGSIGGHTHAFLLTQVSSEPGSLMLVGLALLGLHRASRIRRR